MSTGIWKGLISATRKEVMVNLAASGLLSLGGLLLTWLYQSSRSFGGLFPAVWDFLTSPVAVPLGLLLTVASFVTANMLVFAVIFKMRPGISGSAATLLSAAVTVLFLALLGAGSYAFRDREPPRPRGFKRLTDNDNVVQAAISPDGKFFAYAQDHGDGQQSLNLGQVDQVGASVRLAAPAEVLYGALAFSPDGLRLYYVQYGCNSTAGALYRMATLGGAPMKVKDGLPRYFAYALSPDGRSIAFVRGRPDRGESEVVTAPVARPDEERQVAARGGAEQFMGVPAWSPDGRLLTCALRNGQTGRARLVGFEAATGDEESSREIDWKFVGRVSSLPNEGSLLLSASRVYGPFQMWRFPYPGGAPEPLTGEGNNYDGMSVTADSSAALTVEDELTDDVWVAPPGRPDLAQPVAGGRGRHNDFWGFSWTPGGRILYVREQEDGQHIWSMGPDGSDPARLTKADDNGDPSRGGDNIDPCATPDGRYVVFTRRQGGAYDIWRMDAGGGNLKRLTEGGRNFAPHCSAGGSVVYTSEQNGRWTVRKVGVDGGDSAQVHVEPAQWPAVSPGGSVAFFSVDAANVMRLTVIAPGGQAQALPIPCTASTWAELRWLKPEQELTYVDTRNGVSNIWAVSLPGGAARQLTRFTHGRIFRYDWSADGRLVFSRGAVKRNAVLFNFREPAAGAGG